eukprot:INCI6113.1.p1 GENE.INCI6113.1~~INCI6113.1.p1  ORF type:complete len:642 (+),score=101.86 INCI6113.1:111-1928(+)
MTHARRTGQQTRNALKKRCQEGLRAAIDEAGRRRAAIADLFVLAFNTRDVQLEAKGERDLFYILFIELYKRFPDDALAVLPLLPTFGRFKDYEDLFYACGAGVFDGGECKRLANELVNQLCEGLRNDHARVKQAEIDVAECHLSQAGKYAPAVCVRKVAENKAKRRLRSWGFNVKKFHDFRLRDVDFARRVRNELGFGDAATRNKSYRLYVQKLRSRKLTAERLLCTGNAHQIVPKDLPAGCLRTKRKALLFEDQHNRIRPHGGSIEKKRRHECREAIIKAAKAGNLRRGGAHSALGIVRACAADPSATEAEVLQANWNSIVSSIRETSTNSPVLNDQQPVASWDIVAAVDVSGSMTKHDQRPLFAAIAYGLLTAELASEKFKNWLLTFSAEPRVVRFAPEATIVERVRALFHQDFGRNTNFVAAMRKVLNLVGQKAIESKKWPEIVVFSDMLFDTTEEFDEEMTPQEIVDRMVDDWHAEKTLKPLNRPGISYWNLNPTRFVNGMVAGATEAGVRQLSGFAPGLLKLLRESHNKKEDSITTLRRVLESPRYDDVRSAILGVETNPRFEPQLIGTAASVKSKRSNIVGASDENPVSTRIDTATGNQ